MQGLAAQRFVPKEEKKEISALKRGSTLSAFKLQTMKTLVGMQEKAGEEAKAAKEEVAIDDGLESKISVLQRAGIIPKSEANDLVKTSMIDMIKAQSVNTLYEESKFEIEDAREDQE